MKPAQERNQESLPPKKRDLSVSNSSDAGGPGGGGVAASGEGGEGPSAAAAAATATTAATTGGTTGEDEAVSIQNSAVNSETQGGHPSGEWLQAQAGVHYGVDHSDSISTVPVDPYGMLYKVAVPSVTYSSSNLHPVFSHISQAYTVHSPLLQHPGLSYPPLGYAQIPHSPLQFVSSPYAAVPYALPTGFVPGSLISSSGPLTQGHSVSHLVPYPSIIQEGVVSSPPQAQVASHAFAKPSVILPSEQAASQHLGTVGVIPATELTLRGLYHPQSNRAAPGPRDDPTALMTSEAEMNGGEREKGLKEVMQDSVHTARNAYLTRVSSTPAAKEHSQERASQNRRLDNKSSPGQRSTPDSDLEVQQVVSHLVSSNQSAAGLRKEVSFAPLNLCQSGHRGVDAHVETTGAPSSRTAHSTHSSTHSEHPNRGQQSSHPARAVVLANGQPLLIPIDYQQHLQLPQAHLPGQSNDLSASHAPATPPSVPSFKPSDSSTRACQPERVEAATAPQQTVVQLAADGTQALAASLPVAQPPGSPSHFMKGAIIQLATGELKRVEDLQTQDFVRSAEASGALKIDSSLVMDIRASQQRPGLASLHFTVGEQQSKVTIDVPPEHPFFVFGQGWSSCSPERSAQLYGLVCHRLQVGDTCVSIRLQPEKQPQRPHAPQQTPSRTLSKTSAVSGPCHQLMGPPAPHFRLDRVGRDRHRDGENEAADEEEVLLLGALGHTDAAGRSSRFQAEHPRSQSSFHLHTEGTAFGEAGGAGAAQRRWSSPGLQRYSLRGDEGPRPQIISPGHPRTSFLPQEVKLSIEGRSNAGK